jgi:hypothetical protein
MKIAVFITSVINTHPSPLTYAPRSVFTPQQRFQQTLETIQSVKNHIPDASIYFVEGSALEKDMEDTLISCVDYYYNTSSIEHIKTAVDSPLKGYGEGAQTLYILDIIQQSSYDHVIKLSGRYVMGPKFKLDDFLHENITQCRVNTKHTYVPFTQTPDNCSTVILGIPYSKIDVVKKGINNILVNYRNGIPQGYECVLTQQLWPIHVIDTCGARGPVSVNGENYVCE